MQTLRDIMGLAESVEIGGVTATRGMTVRIKTTGTRGEIREIGRYGLVAVDGLLRAYAPDELEVDKPALVLTPLVPPVRCSRCGRALKQKESIAARMGGTCRKKVERALESERRFAALAAMKAQKEG